MNTNWKSFLLSQQATVNDGKIAFAGTKDTSGKRIYALPHLAVLSVAGSDAAKLLQGQVTCNVHEITETKSSLAAICNPKGRAIATFFLAKQADTFLLVLPVELLETVKKKLQMYVLRADVKITDSSGELCLLGLYEPEQAIQPTVPEIQQNLISVNIPVSLGRKLLMINVDDAMQFWTEQVDYNDFSKADSDEWRYLDLIAGLPWLSLATSEEFVPQMLNLDKLGGISFNKGCYTGQEIVARTHYLGKTKREMVLAECQVSVPPEPNSNILNRDSEGQEVVGKVLQAMLDGSGCTMQVVLQIADPAYNNLGLPDDNQAQLKLLPFTT
jgi:tRNA-modifying protein YgfZ